MVSHLGIQRNMINNNEQNNKLPSLTKTEVIKRIELMIRNSTNSDVIVNLKNALSYVKRLKD